MRHILVTGGAGYIGSHAAKALSEAGYVPVTYDNLSSGHRWAVRWGPLIEGDIADRDRLAEAFSTYDIAAVMHFAAFSHVGQSMREPGRYFANNVGGSLALLEAMRAAGLGHLVFSSTCAIYGVPDAVPIGEETPQRPVNPYGESKLMVERMLGWYGAIHGFRTVSLRYFNAAGADAGGLIGESHDPETHLVPLMLQAALGRRPPLDIYGTDYPTPDGTAIRDYIHVSDLADAHVRALEHLLAGGETLALNLGTGQGHSVREIAAAAERILARPVPRRETDRRPGDPPILVADARRARACLGWQARHSDLDTIIATAWNWHRDRAV